MSSDERITGIIKDVEGGPSSRTNLRYNSNLTSLLSCPECQSELKGPQRYCVRCDKRFGIGTNDIQKNYQKESSTDVSGENVQAGKVIILFGVIMFALIIVTLFPILGVETLILGIICFPFPIFFIILGILIKFGYRSGKYIFCLVWTVFMGVLLIAMVLNSYSLYGWDYIGLVALISTILTIILTIYVSYYIIRKNLKS
jgi:hypothetical protein